MLTAHHSRGASIEAADVNRTGVAEENASPVRERSGPAVAVATVRATAATAAGRLGRGLGRREREALLVHRARAGDSAAGGELVKLCRSDIDFEVYRPGRSLAEAAVSGGAGSEEDLRQEAVLGVYSAIERFDALRGLAFTTYARHWIRKRVRLAREKLSRVESVPEGVLVDMTRCRALVSAAHSDPSGPAARRDSEPGASGMTLSEELMLAHSRDRVGPGWIRSIAILASRPAPVPYDTDGSDGDPGEERRPVSERLAAEAEAGGEQFISSYNREHPPSYHPLDEPGDTGSGEALEHSVRAGVPHKAGSGSVFAGGCVNYLDAIDDGSVRRAVRALPERERHILTGYYGLDGEARMTQQELADSMGLSLRRLRQLQRQAEAAVGGELALRVLGYSA